MSNADQEPEPIEIDEVIPPGESGTAAAIDDRSPAARMLATLLDDCIRIPGTNMRIGLDPIIGMLPIGGQAIASFLGAFIVGEAYKKGVPFSVAIKMGWNMLINAAVGAFPGLGDLFSAWFKSNKRNYAILLEELDKHKGKRKERKVWPVVLTLFVIILSVNIAAWWLIYQGLKALGIVGG